MKYAKRMEKVKASAIRSSQKKIAAKVANGGSVISFAAGLPDPNLYPMEELKDATMKVFEKNGKEAVAYGLSKGDNRLLKLLAKRMQEKENMDVDAENLLVVTGSQQGIAFSAMIFLDKDDIVIAENPSYLGAINAFRPYEPQFLGVDTDEDGIVVEHLDKILSENPNVKMIYVIPSFQNPSGKTCTTERRKAFMEVVNKYDDIVVIEDNPYGEIRFKGEPTPTLKSLDTKGNVVYLGSMSKVLTPGLRVAWVVADKEVVDKMELIKEGADLQCNQFAQNQVAEYLENYDLDAHIEEIRAAYKNRCELMMKTIKEYFPEGVKYTDPDGGMFIWVELPEGIDANEMLDDAIEAGVAYVSGEFFYANEGKKNTIRLNYTTMSEEQIVEGIKILAKVIENKMK